MISKTDRHLLDERYHTLVGAYHCMERDETLGKAEVIGR